MAMQTTLSFNSEEFFSLNIQDLVKLLDLYILLKFSTYPFFLQLKKDWKLPAKDQCRVSVKLHVTKLPNLIKAKFYLKNSSLTQFFSQTNVHQLPDCNHFLVCGHSPSHVGRYKRASCGQG